MYTAYFNLKENPYTIDTNLDSKWFYLSPSHKENALRCEWAIRNQASLVAIYGNYGTGKSSIVLELVNRFSDKSKFFVAVLTDTTQTSDTAFVRAVAKEFGLEKPPRTKQETIDQLQDLLTHEKINQNRTPLLFIDDAHKYGDRKRIRSDRDILDTLHTLTNLRHERVRLLHTLLFGQLELYDYLEQRPALFSRVAEFGFLFDPVS